MLGWSEEGQNSVRETFFSNAWKIVVAQNILKNIYIYISNEFKN